MPLTFFANVYIFVAFAAYLPLTLAKGAGDETLIVKENKCGNHLDHSALIGVMIAFFGDAIGAVLAAIIGAKFGNFGRNLVFKGGAVMALLVTIPAFFTLPNVVTNVLGMLLRCSITGLGYSFWLFSIAEYPTVLRGTISSFTYAVGNCGGILGSLLTYVLFPVSPAAVVGFLAGIAVLQVVASLLLRTGYRKDMIDHIEDVELELQPLRSTERN